MGPMFRRTFAAATLAVLILISPSPKADAADPLIYVALGDSYTAGPLVLPHDSRFVPQDCGQSWRNYPHLVSSLIDADEFRDASCSSANIDDFYKPQEAFFGQITEPQFDKLGPNVDVVTVGIGGNDAGFVSAAVDCMRFRPEAQGGEPSCHKQFVRDGVDKLSVAIEAMRRELGVALDDIHRIAPRAAVFVVSYPTALPDNRRACYPYLPLRQGDMTYLVRKFKEMNRALRSAAEDHQATYVDIYTRSILHDACQPPGRAWVNGGVLVPPSFPAHPNELSYLYSAPIVARAIRAELGLPGLLGRRR